MKLTINPSSMLNGELLDVGRGEEPNCWEVFSDNDDVALFYKLEDAQEYVKWKESQG